MVELCLDPFGLDSIFHSLADPTRRDILRRIGRKAMSVSDVAEPYDMSLAAVSKHLKILEKAKLILKKRKGKELMIVPVLETMNDAAEYLRAYEKLWNDRLDSLERYLSSIPS